MKRFINAKRDEYHNATIAEFSDTSRLMTSGVARGFSSTKYAWLADFLFKQPANLSLNPHTGYVSFFSEREVFHQEYGNVARIYDEYPFLSSYERKVLSSHSFEMTSKQYAKTGQRESEFDVVEYINASYLERGVSAGNADPFLGANYDVIPSSFDVRHGIYRAPCYHATGYRIDMEFASPTWEYFDQYFWSKHWVTRPYVFEDYLRMEISSVFLGDMAVDNDGLEELEDYIDTGETTYFESFTKRLVDYKLQMNNAKLIFFPESSQEWVTYYNDAKRYLGQTYYPYVGLTAFYNNEWREIHPFIGGGGISAYDQYIAFFPEIVQNGVLEPSKIVVNWGLKVSDDTPRLGPAHARLAFNPVNNLGEMDDQSRLIYNVCRYMINLNSTGDRFEVQRKSPDDSMVVYAGIDADTERNRRYSSVVMTEPYFVAPPILNGTLIDYMFVDWTGEPVSFANPADFNARPAIYLRVKAPMSVIAELDRLLALREYNTDIIDAFDIQSPLTHSAEITPTHSDYYEDFATDAETFFRRQDDCLDDLINNIVGSGTHKEFWITPTGLNASKYSDSRMKVCGAAYACKTTVDGFGRRLATPEEVLRLYCSNYTPKSCYENGDGAFAPISNEAIEMVSDTDIFDGRKGAERFRPMLKLHGMNGFVKIVERNPHYKVTRAPDGQYEVTYNVEFPYCPGSYFVRAGMNFTEYETTQVYYKGSYINAGSHESVDVEGEDRYDIANDRYAMYGDDSFTRHEVLVPLQSSGYITTNPSKSGGGIEELVLSEKDLIRYPANLVWQVSDWLLLSLIKPQLDSFREYGTYRIDLWETEQQETIDTDFNIVDDGFSASWNSGKTSEWLEAWVSVRMNVDATGSHFGSNVGSIYLQTPADCTDVPTDDMVGVLLTIPEDDYDIYIGSIEVKENDIVIDYTDFSSGMGEWVQVAGNGLTIVDSPDASGKSLLRTAGSGDGQVLQKVFPPMTTTNLTVTFTVWFPSDPDFTTPAWWDTNHVRMDVVPYNGRGYFGEIVPNSTSGDWDHRTRGTTVVTYGSTIFSRDMKLFAFADNRQWRFGDNSYSSYIGREAPSYVCDVDISTLLEDYTTHQDKHGSIPEMKRWLYGYFSGFAHMSQAPERDLQSTETASIQVSTLPREGVRPLSSTESESDVIIEIWDSESDIGNSKSGNWRPFLPARFDTLKVPGNLVLDGLHRHDIAPIHVVDDLYKIYLSYYYLTDDTQEFRFPDWVKHGSGLDALNGLENVVLYDRAANVWYHIAYMEVSLDIVGKETYAAIVRMSPTDDIPGYGAEVPETGESIDPETLTPVELWPLRIHMPRMQISKSPLSDFYTERALDGSPEWVVGRYVDISDLVNAVRSSDSATNRYVDENNKVKFRIRVSRLKKAFDPATSNNPDIPSVIVNTSHDSEDVSVIQYVGVQSTSGSEWFNYPWTPDGGITFDPGFDFAKVYPAELVRKLGMTYFKCTSR